MRRADDVLPAIPQEFQVRVKGEGYVSTSGGDPSRASRIAFSFPDAEWTVRFVEGEFPN